MKIDTKSIDGYQAMSVEEKLAALEAFEYEEPTDLSAELDRLKTALSKSNSEAAEWKRKHNALITEDEQKKQETADNLAAMQKELETLRRDKTVADHKAQFLALGFEDKLATESAEALADGNMSVVFKNQQKFISDTKKKLEADALNKQPELTKGGADKYKSVTAEQFAKMEYSERLDLFNNDKDTYDKLMGKTP